jgi:ABC-type sugar transport system ATPase subunit
MENELTEHIARTTRELQSQDKQWAQAMSILSRGGQGVLAVPREILQTLEVLLLHQPAPTVVGVRA